MFIFQNKWERKTPKGGFFLTLWVLMCFSLVSPLNGGGMNLKGLTGLIETPDAGVSSGLGYQSIRGISQTAMLQPFMGTVFEGSYLRRFNTDQKSNYNVKMRLFEEGSFMPAFAGGLYDINENLSPRQGFVVASKKIPGTDLQVNVGALRDIKGSGNQFFAGMEKTLFGMVTVQAEYLKEGEVLNGAFHFNPYSGLRMGLNFLDIHKNDFKEIAYTVSFEKGL